MYIGYNKVIFFREVMVPLMVCMRGKNLRLWYKKKLLPFFSFPITPALLSN